MTSTYAVAMHRSRLVGEPEVVESAIKPIAGAIACEDAARSIAAVRGRGESNDQEPRVSWTETGNGTSPVFPITKSRDFVTRDLLAVRDKARTAAIVDDLILCGPFEHSE